MIWTDMSTGRVPNYLVARIVMNCNKMCNKFSAANRHISALNRDYVEIAQFAKDYHE